MSWSDPQVALFADGRLHLQHGPIDLLIGVAGEASQVRAAHEAAIRRFGTILRELTDELPLLRARLAGDAPPLPRSPVGRRMVDACWPHRAVFITPMAAVAGSVADEIAATMLDASPDIRTLYVNNGGDIAVHAAPGAALRIGLVSDLSAATPEGSITIGNEAGVGGVATSGWRGRSFSLGIADAVTVLARDAAAADAAATMIANEVNVEDGAIRRMSARALDPDSDLGNLPVTTDVGTLPREKLDQALQAGRDVAQRLLGLGHVTAAAMALQGRWLVVGRAPALRGTGLKSFSVA